MYIPNSNHKFEFNLSTIITGALTLTAALSWNEAAKTGIQNLYPTPVEKSFNATLIHAIIVTLIIVIIFYIIRIVTFVTQKIKGNATVLTLSSPLLI